MSEVILNGSGPNAVLTRPCSRYVGAELGWWGQVFEWWAPRPFEDCETMSSASWAVGTGLLGASTRDGEFYCK